MALYKYQQYLEKSESESFDKIYSPGSAVPLSGIYRCQGCDREIASNEGDPFPPQNHHQHSTSQGDIRWRLAVYADHKPK
jgi:hypothetical protein